MWKRTSLIKTWSGLAVSLMLGLAIGLTGYGSENTASSDKAAAQYNINGPVTLTVEYVQPNVEFKLYRVAEFTPDSGSYQLIPPFSEMKVSDTEKLKIPSGTDKVGNTDWRTTAQTIYSMMLLGGSYTPTATTTTNNTTTNPNVYKYAGTFSPVQAGLYLLVGNPTSEEVSTDGRSYTPFNMLVSLPYQIINGNWDMAPVVQVKYTDDAPTGEKENKDKKYTVKKQWAGETSKTDRPESIEVKIYCNETEKETVTLSDSNDWTYSWTGNETDKYTVAENNVPDGYTVSISGTTTFVIKNTKTTPPTTPPSNPPTSTTPPPSTSVKTGDETPLIGMIGALAGAGIVIILLGMVLMKKRKTK